MTNKHLPRNRAVLARVALLASIYLFEGENKNYLTEFESNLTLYFQRN